MVTDADLKVAQQGAASAHKSARGLVPLNDLVSEAYLWLAEHPAKVEEWREDGRHGKNKLRVACKRACLRLIATERRRNAGIVPSDQFYYSAALVRELLPFIWDPDDWTTSSQAPSDEIRSPSRPSEGNNRLAMIVDVRAAFYTLPHSDQILLLDLHQGDGRSYETVAGMYEVAEKTVRRREERAIDRIVERLGGEYPFV